MGDRIETLRSLMRARGWDAVVLTGSDPHGSEYPAERYKQVRYLTGFTGEAGDIVVTLDHAGLWTDSRYFLQAREQLPPGCVLHKTRVPDEEPIPDFLLRQLGPDAVIAIDSLCTDSRFAASLTGDVIRVPDLLNTLWQDRPAIPQTPVFTVETGESRREKTGRIREALRERKADAVLLTALDEIAWTLNVRASDIEYNPYVISYLLISDEEVRWFVRKDPVEDADTAAAFRALEADGVILDDYDAIFQSLTGFGCLWADGGSLNEELGSILRESGVRLLDAPTPACLLKAVKNSVEITRLRETHVQDGLVMERFLYWLERSMMADKTVSEWDASVKLGQLRAGLGGYQGDSFETISARGASAALPHYVTPRENAPLLEPEGLYLCDSGGQFLGGTTDITRTVPLGPCSPEACEDYTLVLKGHIALAMAVFPAGTPGCRLDALARAPLWQARRNFGHGTGHGVGFFLGVHEGPQSIRQDLNPQALLPGMVVSCEPGIYREGLYGIRHENLLLCVDDGDNDFGGWLRFEPLTLCHFDTAILQRELLTEPERAWLNAYNARVRDTLCPLLDTATAAWLRAKCTAI